jgi:hypothetical protein
LESEGTQKDWKTEASQEKNHFGGSRKMQQNMPFVLYGTKKYITTTTAAATEIQPTKQKMK